MKELKETHERGSISIENVNTILGNVEIVTMENPRISQLVSSLQIDGDFGIQIAKDGRVWVCINGVAFLRFKPEIKGGKHSV